MCVNSADTGEKEPLPRSTIRCDEEATMNESSVTKEPTDFSLVLGGPLYQLFRRAHLTGDVYCERINTGLF
jgi:hypothetical protein